MGFHENCSDIQKQKRLLEYAVKTIGAFSFGVVSTPTQDKMTYEFLEYILKIIERFEVMPDMLDVFLLMLKNNPSNREFLKEKLEIYPKSAHDLFGSPTFEKVLSILATE